MATLGNWIARAQALELDRRLGLRPPYPPVALELERGELRLVRIKRRRRGAPLVEAHRACRLEDGSVPASIFQQLPADDGQLAQKLQALFEGSGTRPGRVSLVLPDNLAKVTLLALPERPASTRQLDELVRAKMRRAVPFRLEDAVLSHQVLAGPERQVSVLVVLVRRAVVERFEQALEKIGARAGLVDLATTNLINLCRGRMAAAAREGADIALLNRAEHYFSLAVVRDQRLIFFRCKSFVTDEEDAPAARDGVLARELANSLAYYREKLDGRGIGTLLVRNVVGEVAALAARLGPLGFGRIEPIDLGSAFETTAEAPLDARERQRVLPALAAAAGRG